MRAQLPQVLAAILGVIAAALAYREVAVRARRHQPPDDSGPDGHGPDGSRRP